MLALVFIILVVGAVVYYKQTAGSDNAKMVKELTRGKNPVQTDVITYFTRYGCGAKTITDDQYYGIVANARSQYNSMQKALNKIGLDEDEERNPTSIF